jgi:hypothetical protein
VKGAFIGEITEESKPSETLSTHNAILTHRHFLVVPIIPIDNHNTEIKWCGNTSPGTNDIVGDEIELIINAYAHHTYEDSGGSLVFVDIQGVVNKANSTVKLIDPQVHT